MKKKCKAIIQKSIDDCMKFYKKYNVDFMNFQMCYVDGQINMAIQLGLITDDEKESYLSILNSIKEEIKKNEN